MVNVVCNLFTMNFPAVNTVSFGVIDTEWSTGIAEPSLSYQRVVSRVSVSHLHVHTDAM